MPDQTIQYQNVVLNTLKLATIVGTDANGLEIDAAVPHLMQSDSTTQSIISTSSSQLVTFDTDIHHSLITRTSSSRFTIQRTGSYLIHISATADINSSGNNKHIEVWMRVNGTDVANSNRRVEIVNPSLEMVVSSNFLYHFDAGDYFEMWTWGDSTNCEWLATAAGSSPTRPAVPSVILTCNYIGFD